MRSRFALDLAECNRALTAALDEASSRGWSVTIAIVDDGGVPITLARMDEATQISVQGAIEKARSAALVGIDTKIMEQMVKDRPGVATMGRVAVEGGLPLLHQGQRVGGVGVSGRQSHEDAEIAQVAVAALQ